MEQPLKFIAPLLVIVVLAGAFGIYLWATCNAQVTPGRSIDAAWSDITVQLKRRADLRAQLTLPPATFFQFNDCAEVPPHPTTRCFYQTGRRLGALAGETADGWFNQMDRGFATSS